MSDASLLSILRKSTMPIHKKLDQQGIGAKLRAGTFGAEDYESWIKITYCTNFMLLEEKKKFRASAFSDYIDHDFGLHFLSQDAGKPIECLPRALSTPNGDSAHHLIAIAYTFLGSSLGSEYIYRYVRDNIPSASTHFLEFMAGQKSKWFLFKEEVEAIQSPINLDDLSSYSRLIFERIFEIQSGKGN